MANINDVRIGNISKGYVNEIDEEEYKFSFIDKETVDEVDMKKQMDKIMQFLVENSDKRIEVQLTAKFVK